MTLTQQQEPRLLNKVFSVVNHLGIISNCTVLRTKNKEVIYIRNQRATAPEFELRYSREEDVFYVYIWTCDTDGNLNRGQYPFMELDSGLSAVELCSVIQVLFRRRHLKASPFNGPVTDLSILDWTTLNPHQSGGNKK